MSNISIPYRPQQLIRPPPWRFLPPGRLWLGQATDLIGRHTFGEAWDGKELLARPTAYGFRLQPPSQRTRRNQSGSEAIDWVVITPSGQLTEGLTWATTGITFGASIAAALAGQAIDAWGTPRAFWVAAAFGVGTAVIALVGVRWLHPTDPGQRLGSELPAPPA